MSQVVDVGTAECLFVISIDMHGSRWTAMVVHHRNPSSYIALHRATAEKLLMTKLASHLRLSRHGVYYYRVGFARQNGGKKPSFCVSLRTCNRREAARLSYNITVRLMHLHQVLRVNTDAQSASGDVGIDSMIREVKQFVQRCVARLRDGDASALAEPVANDVAALVDQTLVLEHQRTTVSATAAPLVPATLSGAGSQDVPAIIAQAFSQAFLAAMQALKSEAVTPAPSETPPPIRLAGWNEAIVHWEGENAPSWAVKTKLDFPSAVRALRDWCLQKGIESPQQVTAEIMAEYKVYLATQYPNVRKRNTGQLGLGLATINKHLARSSSRR
ncbi:MAG: hypothetical protein IT518_04250 [Burkholderiales bacterium]|nr:hypothetical protein [Burkholderiales bacterium]